MHAIGNCLLNINKCTEAIEYFKKALQIQKQTSLDVDKDKSVADIMHVIGKF